MYNELTRQKTEIEKEMQELWERGMRDGHDVFTDGIRCDVDF